MSQDIFLANPNNVIHNASLLVGVPGVKGVAQQGFNTSYAAASLLPVVASISGKYGRPVGRFDDANYYAGDDEAKSISAGTYFLTSVPTSFISGIGKCLSVVVNRHPTGVNTSMAYVGNETNQLLSLKTGDFKGYNLNISDPTLLYASGAVGDTLSWTVLS